MIVEPLCMVWPLPGAFELSVSELSVFESIGFKSRIFRCLGECNEPLLECQRDQNREFLSFLTRRSGVAQRYAARSCC
jgi:hypothetical protein